MDNRVLTATLTLHNGAKRAIESKPFRWGGMTGDYDRTAGEWIKACTSPRPVWGGNPYICGCAFCGRAFPDDEPLYCILTSDDRKFKYELLDKDCARHIAAELGVEVTEPRD